MPHVLLKGTVTFEKFQQSFENNTFKVNDWVLKFQNCYLSYQCNTLLIDTVAIRSGFAQSYYLLVEQKKNQVTVRIDPHTNVEKNEGVKRSVVRVAEEVITQFPGLIFDKTNINSEYLPSSFGG